MPLHPWQSPFAIHKFVCLRQFPGANSPHGEKDFRRENFCGNFGARRSRRFTSELQEPVKRAEARAPKPAKPSALLDTRVVYCGDNLEQLAKRGHKVIVALTVQKPLDKHIAGKWV